MAETVRTYADLQTRLADNTAGEISPEDVRDLLASTYQLDYSADVSVTGATTATIGKWHICTGTSADYTVTLPAASGNAGKIIGLRMSSALTKLVTLDGNGSELIDGATTRVMWANEVAILFCDGTGWTKIGGKSIPMQAMMLRTSSQTLTSGGAFDKVLFGTIEVDIGGMANTANSRFDCKRAGTYNCFGFTYASGVPTGKYLIYQLQSYNASNVKQDDLRLAQGQSSGGSNVLGVAGGALVNLSATDYVQFYTYSDSSTPAALSGSVSIQTHGNIIETPSW